jgi:hypothetical protein
VENNLHQIPVLKETDLLEEWTEEVKVAIKKTVEPTAPAEGAAEGDKKEATTQQDFETRQQKKTTTTSIDRQCNSHAQPPAQRAQFKQLEEQLTLEDRKLLDLKEAKNKLETMCYGYRENLSEYGNYEKYMEETPRKAFLESIQQMVDWLYGEGEASTLEEYVKRITAFASIGEPVKKRYIFFTTIDDSFKRFEELAARSAVQLEAIAHLTDEQRKSVIDKLQLGRDFLAALRKEIDTKPKSADPTTTLADVDKKIDLLAAELKSIFSTPAPKVEAPKVEETKPEEEAQNEMPAAEEQPSEPEVKQPAADEDMN